MSYLRYHHILLIGIMVEKCENWGEEKKNKTKNNNLVSQALFLVTRCTMRPCQEKQCSIQ